MKKINDQDLIAICVWFFIAVMMLGLMVKGGN